MLLDAVRGRVDRHHQLKEDPLDDQRFLLLERQVQREGAFQDRGCDHYEGEAGLDRAPHGLRGDHLRNPRVQRARLEAPFVRQSDGSGFREWRTDTTVVIGGSN